MASSPGKAASSLAAIKKRVAGAIQIGAPLYNSGNVAGCETVSAAFHTLLPLRQT
jgi:hypothetical protein